MFRLIGVAVAIGIGVWALLRRRPGGAAIVREPIKTRTTIVIGGTASAPTITRQPERLVAVRGHQLIWDIENTTGATQEISLRGFRKQDHPPGGPPVEKNDADRTIQAGSIAQITDRVRGDAVRGTYKYDIWLNKALAVDPDVVIYEGA